MAQRPTADRSWHRPGGFRNFLTPLPKPSLPRRRWRLPRDRPVLSVSVGSFAPPGFVPKTPRNIPHGACLVGTVANSPQLSAIECRMQCFVAVIAGVNVTYAAVVAKLSLIVVGGRRLPVPPLWQNSQLNQSFIEDVNFDDLDSAGADRDAQFLTRSERATSLWAFCCVDWIANAQEQKWLHRPDMRRTQSRPGSRLRAPKNQRRPDLASSARFPPVRLDRAASAFMYSVACFDFSAPLEPRRLESGRLAPRR